MQPVRSASLPLGAPGSSFDGLVFDAGAMVLRPATTPRVPMVVESGALALWVSVGPKARAVVEVLGPGDPIWTTRDGDDRPLLQPEVVALTRSVVRPHRPRVDPSGREDRLAPRVETLHRALARALCLRVPERLHEVMLGLADRFGTTVSSGRRIDLPLSQDLLAAMVGATRETVNRAIRTLSARGVVRRVGSAYVVSPSRPMTAIRREGSSAGWPDRPATGQSPARPIPPPPV